MNYISFSVDGQKLSCSQRYYSSTGTINTLSCSFEFKTNDSQDTSGWDLPYFWAQFHDKNGNTYVKPVNDNACAIPSDCLKQPEFKMTLFATDTEDYMVCTKRYTTNEVTFRFNGDANLDYDGGVSPDDLPTNWQILIDKVAEYENRVDGLSQSVTAMGNRIDGLDVDLANESTARADEDTRLEGLIGNEKTVRENADADLRLLINDETNERTSGDNALQNELNERTSAFLSVEEDGVYINYINKNKENV
jgi:hypothetical protein